MKDFTAAGVLMDFGKAIAPMTRETFFAEYFERRHFVIRREDRDYYRDLLSVTDIDAVLTQTVLTTDELNMVNKGNAVPFDDFCVPAGSIDPVRVAACFAQGATIILPVLHRRLPALLAYCRALETVFSCELQTNIYFTPDNAQGFKTHYDSHDVIVLQTHGTKTWRIHEFAANCRCAARRSSPRALSPGP